MKRVKLPSGRIIDIDAISSITAPKSYNTGKSCLLIVGGCTAEVCNGDADALYTAVLATVEPIRMDDADEHGNVAGRYLSDGDADAMHAMIDDILYRTRNALELIGDGAQVKAADALEAILNDYSESDEDEETKS